MTSAEIMSGAAADAVRVMRGIAMARRCLDAP